MKNINKKTLKKQKIKNINKKYETKKNPEDEIKNDKSK